MMNQLKTVLLLGVLTTLLIAFGGVLGEGYLYGFTALALLMNVGSYFFSDKIVLAMHGARPVSLNEAPGLYRMVEELSRRAQIPTPRIYLINDPQPNAFATGRNPEHGVVAVTEGLMRLLDERELRGVIAHELAHIKNRDILVASIAATFASAISSLSNILAWTGLFGGSSDDEEGGAGNSLLLMFVAPIAATLLQLGISRSREFMADETGAAISGDPEALARALEKLSRGVEVLPTGLTSSPATASLFIVNPMASMGSLLKLFSTHPPMEERIRRLRQLRPTSPRYA